MFCYLYDEIGNLTQDLEGKNDKIFWTAYGKVSKVIKDNNDSILYRYDATGQRISKTFKDKTTFYVRDASGNVMATYEQIITTTNTITTTATTVKEINIYGSARVGVYNGKSERMKATLGNKNYELSNHLGNVLVTITDNKFIETVGVFVAKVNSTTDYYPFGMAIVERTWQSKEYRYGFNTQEKDLDIDKSGNHTTAEFWEYDSRSGRRWNVDPVVKPWESGYVVNFNNPIQFNDPKGDIAPAVWAAIVYALETGAETGVDVALGVTLTYLTGVPYTGWEIVGDYFSNLVPGWGEIKKVKKVAQISEAMGKVALKIHKITGSEKLIKNAITGLERFKNSADLEDLQKFRGVLYELKLASSLDNVLAVGVNERAIASYSKLSKAAGDLLNRKFGTVTFDIVQQTPDGVLNLIEAKASTKVKGAISLFGKGGIDSDDAKDLVKKMDFFKEFKEQGGKGTLEFRFSEEVTDELRNDLYKFAEKRGISKNELKVTTE